MLADDLVIQPPSADVSLEVAVGEMMRPSTTHWMEEAGLELDVTHSRLRVSLILAVSGPVMVRVSGATENIYIDKTIIKICGGGGGRRGAGCSNYL